MPQVRFLNLGLTSIFVPITARQKHGTTGRFLFRYPSPNRVSDKDTSSACPVPGGERAQRVALSASRMPFRDEGPLFQLQLFTRLSDSLTEPENGKRFAILTSCIQTTYSAIDK